MKTLFYRLIFGNVRFKVSTTEKKVLCRKLIGPGFYEFLQFIQEHPFKDLHNKQQKSKNLSAILQKTESDCMNSFLSLLHANNVDAIPIYGAVLVPVNQQQVVKNLCEYFVDENLEYFGIKFTCKTEF